MRFDIAWCAMGARQIAASRDVDRENEFFRVTVRKIGESVDADRLQAREDSRPA